MAIVNHIKISNLFKDINSKKGFYIIFLLASFVLIMKLLLSFYVYGTNDVESWTYFSDIIEKFGSFKIYSQVGLYNHPPLMSWVLKLLRLTVEKTALPFPFIFRLLPIFADYGSCFVIWKLLKKIKLELRLLISIISVINPISFLISGFHGNTDSIFIFLILLAIYLINSNRIILSGIIYGLSLCIKIVPIILLPVFIFYLRNKKEKKNFILAASILPIGVFLPYLINDFHSIKNNIFLYSGVKGIWGISHILASIGNNAEINAHIRQLSYILFKLHISSQLIILTIITGLSKFFITLKKISLTEGVFLVFCIFLIITPGFGIQYLSWLSYFAIMTQPLLGVIYSIIGGLFLFRVYSYWGGSVPPYFANSFEIGPWIGFEKILDLVLWTIVIIMLIEFIRKQFINKPVNQ